jgi:hypothetical protein
MVLSAFNKKTISSIDLMFMIELRTLFLHGILEIFPGIL